MYVHGYSDKEAQRLCDQASTLDEMLHHDSVFSEGSHVLEAGCGVGSQTKIITQKNPSCFFTSIDISQISVDEAKKTTQLLHIENVQFETASIFDLPYQPASFDHVFVCFVLEHLPDPVGALLSLQKVLKKGGTITVIEGDHGSAYFYPNSTAAQNVINCQVALQAKHGGNAYIGREIYPLLCAAGFSECNVSPRMVYADGARPELAEGFTRKTFTAMIEGVREDALLNSLVTKQQWDQGICDLYRTAEPDGVFCYTFFKGTAVNK